MPVYGEGVRGINDLKVYLLTADVPAATGTDFTGVKAFSVEVSSDSDQQRGDDAVLMVVQENKSLDVTMSAAYANLAAIGVVTATAPVIVTGPPQVTTWSDPASANTAYCQIAGQAKGRDTTGSALRLTVLKAQLTGGPNWDLSEGAWMEPELVFVGVGRGTPTSVLYTVAAYQTEVPMT